MQPSLQVKACSHHVRSKGRSLYHLLLGGLAENINIVLNAVEHMSFAHGDKKDVLKSPDCIPEEQANDLELESY